MIAFGLASLVNAKADNKTSLRCADLSLVKRMRTEERMTGLKANRVKELFLKLAPAGRGDDDSSPWPIEKTPESCGDQDSRCFTRAVTGSQGRRVARLNVAKGFPLPLVRPNSKDAFRELENSEPGFWRVHRDHSNFAGDLPPVDRCGTMPSGYEYAS